jgi:hypothetical protein
MAKPGAHAAAVRTSSGSASGSGGSGWWSDAANNDATPAMDAWQHQPASPSSFLMADGCPLPPYASPTSADTAAAADAAFIDAAADDAFTADVAAIFRRGSGDSTTSSLPLAQPQQNQVPRYDVQADIAGAAAAYIRSWLVSTGS